jgi:hypothetical protein
VFSAASLTFLQPAEKVKKRKAEEIIVVSLAESDNFVGRGRTFTAKFLNFIASTGQCFDTIFGNHVTPRDVYLNNVLRGRNNRTEVNRMSSWDEPNRKSFRVLTGHPSDKDFSDKSDMCEHDSSEMLDNLLQCLLSGTVAASEIFLHSAKSKCSMLWQC